MDSKNKSFKEIIGLMIDKSNYRFNKVVSPETRYMHLMESVEEARRNF